MRRPFAVIAFVLTFAFGAFVAATPVLADGAPPPQPKVVIIVGATHATTSTYRSYANAAYAEAIKYTPNVKKVYSPNATWSAVKNAVVGANVVIYFGHGNGWPSPYAYDPKFTTKDGFGLNATAGNGDSNMKYYGEPYVSTLDLAPGAVILLHHLCYASGNSEPGYPAPTRSVAKQRVDNYGAGFLKAGVAAVIADGHRGPIDYLAALFAPTDQTLADLWRTQPNYRGHEFGFGSSRTPGMTALMDPDTSTSGYYRSFIGNPAATTADVRNGTQPVPPPPPPGAYAVQMVFTDLWDSPFVASIQWIYDQRITVGCTSTRYCPLAPVTRGQMATFLARAMDLPPATKDYFSDDDGLTHEAAINSIAEAGITGGCAPRRFCRDEPVSRAQMAAFLVRALDVPAATKDWFSDDDGSTLEQSINAMAEAGLTRGCGEGVFCPNQSVTREQMAAFLVRAFKTT
ncbi:MAG TPA: S-layer homology domain-containing protein [Candidatus Limnocylindrales bacterium]|nr:S-layer homology domain-containing protein [Candidatus Limnocylindrales bacterium]